MFTPTNPPSPASSDQPTREYSAGGFPPPAPGAANDSPHATQPLRATRSAQPTRDQIIMMGAGGLSLIASFLPWVSVSLGFVSGSGSAWLSGLPAWFSVLVCMAVAAAVAADVFLAGRLPALVRFITPSRLIAGAVLGLALMIVRAIWLPSIPGVSIGLGAGFFVALIASVAQVVSAARYRRTQQAAR